jgi:ankyrin repeat protein
MNCVCVYQIKYNKLEAVACLLDAKANYRKARGTLGTPLHFAAKFKRDVPGLLQVFASRPIRIESIINIRDKHRGQTPLMIAAETASEAAVSALIEAHADVNSKAQDKVFTHSHTSVRPSLMIRVLTYWWY